MTYAILTIMLLFIGSQNAVAGDLPVLSNVQHKTSKVDIYGIDSVALKDETVDRNGRLVGVLEIKLNVEGNICDSEPDTLSFSLDRFSSSQLKISLLVSRPYEPEPTVIHGCLTYSRRSQVVVPVEVSFWSPREGNSLNYALQLSTYPDPTEIIVTVKVVNGRLVASIN